MKNLILGLTSCFIAQLSFAQNKMDVNVTGIDPKIEKNMLAGDQINYWQAASGDGHQNIRVRVTGKDGKDVFFSSLDAAPGANNHYDFNQKITITDGKKFSFDEELELLVYVETVFGNVLWTEVTRNKSNLSDPIVLDKYTWRQAKTTPPMRRLILNYYYKGNNNGVEEKVKANEDGWENRKISDFRFQLKNLGDSDWKIDTVFQTGQNLKRTYVRVNIPFEKECPIQLDKKIVVRCEGKTEKGNMTWQESVVTARELRRFYIATDFALAGEDASSDSNLIVNDETTDDGSVNSDDQTDNTTTNNTSTIIANTNITTTTTTTATSTLSGGATDLTTITVLASCSDMVKGDTLIAMNGSKVCVRAIKPDGAKAMTGTLAMDCNFNINGTIFPLKGNETIKCNKADGKLTEGKLRANTTFNSSAGTIILKEGSLVQFRNGKLITGSLAENAKLNVNGKSIMCSVNPGLDSDIRFDVQERLVECSLAEATSINAKVDLKLPKMSRLIYKSGKLNRAICAEATSFALNGKTINVEGHSSHPAYNFTSNNVLSEVYAGKGNTIKIGEQEIAIKEGTKIDFEVKGESLEIVKFYTANQVTLNVQKGKSVKEVTVKASKKIVLSAGKAVKAG